jgi:hypothetical protein
MPLSSGTRLGSYEITHVGLIGQGDTDNPLALRQFTIVPNWFEELKARVPGR